MINDALM